MQVKTIRKAIRTKMEAWLEKITDETLRKDVSNNLLVSGGCITSMLLNEPVNDFDVYLMDKQVLLRLAKYYTQGFDGSVEVMAGWERDSLMAEFDHVETEHEGGICARAVAIESMRPEQVKLFVTSKEGGMRVNEDKPENEGLYIPMFLSPNSISLTDNVQIVLRFTGNAEEIHSNYDFIHATNYYTTGDGLVLNQRALESILTKQLYYQGSKYPVTSIIRIKKFIKRGWNISAGEMLKIMFQVSELNLKDPKTLEEQLVGVDVAYFGTLIGILRNAKPEGGITSEYLNKIIDKVFSEDEGSDNL